VHLAEERQQRPQQDYEDGYEEEMKFSGVHRGEKQNGGFTKGTKLAPKETKVSKFKVGKKQDKSLSDLMLANYLKSPPRDAQTLTVDWKTTEEAKAPPKIEPKVEQPAIVIIGNPQDIEGPKTS
jgi:hypothetical protein